jgi:hypothetical protein
VRGEDASGVQVAGAQLLGAQVFGVILHPRPEADYVRWVLSRFELPDAVALEIRKAFAID